MTTTLRRGAPKRVTTESASESPEQIYERFAGQGDRAAFEELVSEWNDTAYRVARCICKSGSLAEEAVQEAFLDVLRLNARFENRGPGSFRAWFMGLVSNRALASLRSERRAQRKKDVNQEDYRRKKQLDGAPDPSDQGRELKAVIERALEDLSERWRAPIVLHVLQGMQQKEIASALGVSQQMVSKRIAQGLEMLRSTVAKAGYTIAIPAILKTCAEGGLFDPPAGMAGRVVTKSRTVEIGEAIERASRRAPVVASGARGVGVTIVALAAAGVSAWWLLGPDADPQEAKPGDSSSAVSPARSHEQVQPRRWMWDFSNSPTDDFKVVFGKWDWRVLKETGQKALVAEKSVVGSTFLLPAEYPKRPLILRVRVRSINRGQWNLGAGWTDGLQTFPYRKWRFKGLKTHFGKSDTFDCFLVGRATASVVHGEVKTLGEHTTPFDARYIYVTGNNLSIESIELREVSKEDVHPAVRDIDKLIASMKGKALEFGGYTFKRIVPFSEQHKYEPLVDP